MKERLKKTIIYAGVEPEEFKRILPDIIEANRKTSIIFAYIVAIVSALLTFGSLFEKVLVMNRVVYITVFLMMTLVFIIPSHVSKNKIGGGLPHIIILFSCIYIFGLQMSINDPMNRTVNFMIMLVALPVLIVGRPIIPIIINAVYIAVFCVLCYNFKAPELVGPDIIDAVVYGAFGPILSIFVNIYKIRSFHLSHQLYDSSRRDILTGIYNRNCFENEFKLFADRCKTKLACVYVDANGLHEINNTRGHKAGDLMLKSIADNVAYTFGSDNSYRVGGDEFVAIAYDTDYAVLKEQAEKLNRRIEREGYHVAIGYDVMNKDSLNVDALIKSAEGKMYKAKSEYYREVNRDRRAEIKMLHVVTNEEAE